MKLGMSALLLSFLFITETYAGSVSELKEVGFSKNGRYFAFVTTESNGMSDHTCRTTTFINTARNEWVGRPYKVCQFSDGEFSVEHAKKLRRTSIRDASETKRLIKKLGIDFANEGQQVISRYPFRYWKAAGRADTEFSIRGESITFTSAHKTRYRLRLSKKIVSSSRCNDMMFSHPPAVISLRMRNLTTKESTPLQVDRRIPKTRGCPFHYRLQNVYTHPRGNGSVVVALMQFFSPSIEGPDERYLVVSGRMN